MSKLPIAKMFVIAMSAMLILGVFTSLHVIPADIRAVALQIGPWMIIIGLWLVMMAHVQKPGSKDKHDPD